MAKERGLTLTDDELRVIEFLNVMDRPKKIRRSNDQIGADDTEFLESLGIRLWSRDILTPRDFWMLENIEERSEIL
jgi:hypothetical protein